MLTSLHIKDVAIIDELEIAFAPGLNVMTGETGAGKTIIVEALKLVLGGRAAAESIRAECPRATITAVFELPERCEPLRMLLENAGLDADRELVLHREVTREGRGVTVEPVRAGAAWTVAWVGVVWARRGREMPTAMRAGTRARVRSRGNGGESRRERAMRILSPGRSRLGRVSLQR